MLLKVANALTSVAASAADSRFVDFDHCTAIISGSFTMVYDIQVTADGSTWVAAYDIGGARLTGLTAAGAYPVASAGRNIRVNVTVATTSVAMGIAFAFPWDGSGGTP